MHLWVQECGGSEFAVDRQRFKWIELLGSRGAETDDDLSYFSDLKASLVRSF
jgi:hypothetical protein